MTLEKDIPPPPPRVKVARLTPTLKAMRAGESALLEYEVGMALRGYGAYHGWTTRQQLQPSGKLRIWRVL